MTAEQINGQKPTFFDSAIASCGDKNIIPATGGDDAVSQEKGFGNKFSTPRGSGGKSVGRRDMNGLLNGISSLNYYFQYTGRNPWVSGQSYPKGAKVWHEGTTAEYVSTADSNTTTPGATGASWIKLNDLSGTSGGGTTVDCAWSGKGADISTLLQNAGKIPGLETKINVLTGDVSTLKSDMTNVKSDVSTLKSSMSTMSTKLDTISTKVEKQTQTKVFSLDDSILPYFPCTESSSTSSSYTLLRPAFITCKGDYTNPGSYVANVTYNGYVYQLPLPTCRIAAGATLNSIKGSGGTSTLSKDNWVVAYVLDGIDLSTPTQTSSYSSTTEAYNTKQTITSSTVSTWLDVSITQPTILTLTIPVPQDPKDVNPQISVFCGNVGSTGLLLYNGSPNPKATTLDVRLLITTSNKYINVVVSRGEIKSVTCTVKKFII